MIRVRRGAAIAATAVIASLVLAACGGSDGGTAEEGAAAEGTAESAPAEESAEAGGAGQPGGTLTILTSAEQFLTLDPQVVYTGEDLAFLGATIQRSLTAYQVAEGDVEGTTLVPDMATDTGTASEGGKVWSFTLRDGITWEDGAPVTCADVAYGTSRQALCHQSVSSRGRSGTYKTLPPTCTRLLEQKSNRGGH